MELTKTFKAKLIAISVLVVIFVLSVTLSGCYIKKYAQKKVENEELTIKLERAQRDLTDTRAALVEVRNMKPQVDTIVLHTTEIREVVRESQTDLDIILQRIDQIQSDINQIKKKLK